MYGQCIQVSVDPGVNFVETSVSDKVGRRRCQKVRTVSTCRLECVFVDVETDGEHDGDDFDSGLEE